MGATCREFLRVFGNPPACDLTQARQRSDVVLPDIGTLIDFESQR